MVKKNKREIVEAVRHGKKLFEAVIALADEVEDYDQFRRDKESLQVQVNTLIGQVIDLKTAISTHEAGIQAVAKKETEAQKQAAQELVDAERQADQIIREAKVEGERVKAQGRKDVEEYREKLRGKIDAAEEKLTALELEARRVEGDIRDRKGVLSGLEESIEGQKARINKMLEV